MTERLFHSRRKSRFGLAIIAAGALFVLGAAGYGYRNRLADTSSFCGISCGFVVTKYPVRIALRAPLLPRLHTGPVGAAAERREVAGPTVTEISSELNPKLPLTLPIRPEDGQKRQPSVPKGSRDQTAIDDLGGARFLKMNYSIAGEGQDKAIVVRKKIIIDDVEVGLAELKIAEGSDILIRLSDLTKLDEGKLGGSVISALRKSEYVNFDELRSLGLTVRYDAVHDRVLVSSEST